MASRHDPLLPNNFKFIHQSKFVGNPFFIIVILTCFAVLLNYATYNVLVAYTTYSYDYSLKRPTEVIQPADPVLLSLHTSFAELQNVYSLVQTLIDESNSPPTLRDCNFLLLVAMSQLDQSIKLLTAGQGDHEVFVAPDTFAVSLLIQTSLAAQKKCLEGLEKMGSTVLNDVIVRVQRCTQCTSNSSAIFTEKYPLKFRAFRRRTCLFNYICSTSNL